MKWSWKSFFIQLVAVFVVALGVSDIISKIIGLQRGPCVATTFSMGIGFTLIIFATLGGWRHWNFKMPLVITFIVAGLFTANPAVAILSLPFSALVYFAATKIRDLISYYRPPVTAPNNEKDSE